VAFRITFFRPSRKLEDRHLFLTGGYRTENNAELRLDDHLVMPQQMQPCCVKVVAFPIFSKCNAHNIFQRILLQGIMILG